MLWAGSVNRGVKHAKFKVHGKLKVGYSKTKMRTNNQNSLLPNIGSVFVSYLNEEFWQRFSSVLERVLFKIFLLCFPLFDAVKTYFQFSKHIKRNVLWRKIFERFIVTFLFAFYLKVIELGSFLSEIWF